VHIAATLEPVPARNVLARIAGVGTPERRELAREAIVLSAHYDHLGTRPAAPGEDPDVDRIFNGADDDASGVAAVLEIAEALALGPAPARDVLVLFATGEEMGLLGTLHYLDHPVVPLERTVLNLNFEMVGRPDPLLGPGRLWLTGDERTNLLGELVARGFDVAADPRPEQNFFRRSDNWAFARLGIVAQTLSSYGMHGDYHKVSDQWWTLDYEHMAAALVGALEIARLAAAGELDPQWLPGGKPE
jgi:Zn-dependent M28 family amino/carboxypeptidase